VTRFKTPELVVRLEQLPVLAAGKPDRAALRQMAADLLRTERAG
jgi:acyl-CoA synthetase (AMP-forming)/AMP-acid ligase II